MITEDYVSFEIAKLLKERGFDAECHSHYYPCLYPDGSIQYHKYNRTAIKKNKTWYDIYSLKNLPKDHYLAPTLQMAMKWLREEHHIFIRVIQSHIEYCSCEIYYNSASCYTFRTSFDSYEEACDVAIKYCLEKLI